MYINTHIAHTPKGLPRTGSIPRMQRGLPERRKIKDVAKVIAVSSAKGGVGKSTVAGSSSPDSLASAHQADIHRTLTFPAP